MPILKNTRHELFAQAYATGATAAGAYAKAGYSPSYSNAQRMSRNEAIKARVDEIKSNFIKHVEERAAFVGISVDRVLEELTHIALVDPTDIAEWGDAIPTMIPDMDDAVFIQGVRLIPSKELSARARAAISEVRMTKAGIVVKFHSKVKALELIGRHLDMFKDKLEVSGKLTLEQLVMASMRPRVEQEQPKAMIDVTPEQVR